MSLDGIVINSIKTELSQVLNGGKIDKVYQPEEDEIILSIRNGGENYRLLLSASSNNPRIHLTNISKENPMSPPMFCMLLRKNIQGATISDIYQPELERIVSISIDSKDELGYSVSKQLIIEIMGKHSNIILVNSETSKIMDSIKRIPAHMSSVRQILPGLEYVYPPAQDKLNPLETEVEDLIVVLKSSGSDPTFKCLYKNIMGMSPLIAREICFRAEMDSDRLISLLNPNEISVLADTIYNFYQKISSGDFKPNIVRDRNNFNVVAFSAVRLFQYLDFPYEEHDSISYVLEKFYSDRDIKDRIKQKSSDLRKNISSKLDRLINKVNKQKKELEDSKKREKFKIKGDLLTANMHNISQGDSSISVQNFYSEDADTIEIKLDPRLSPSENAQKYYKKYNKLKTASELLKTEVEKAESEIEYLNNILYSIDNCTELDEIDEIKEELANEGYLKRPSSKKKGKPKKMKSKPHEYVSSDGYTIYVGKNNHQNDRLTMKTADKDDLWFHTKDIPGSHVIVKSGDKDLPENTIVEAALLAAYYSKGSQSSNVPVDYTEKKNVKKPNGSKPGMVIYENNNTIYVTPSDSDISKIKKVES